MSAPDLHALINAPLTVQPTIEAAGLIFDIVDPETRMPVWIVEANVTVYRVEVRTYRVAAASAGEAQRLAMELAERDYPRAEDIDIGRAKAAPST